MNALDGITIGLHNSISASQLVSIASDFAHLHDFIDSLEESKWKNKCYSTLNTGDSVVSEIEEHSKLFGELHPGKALKVY